MKKIILNEYQMRFVVDSIINEQVSQTQGKTTDVIYSTVRDANAVNNSSIHDTAYYVGADVDPSGKFLKNRPDGVIKYDQLVNEMKGKMDQLSAKVFDSMRDVNPKFYYYVLYQYVHSGLRRGKNQKIVVDSKQSIEQPPPIKQEDKVTYEPGYELQTGGNTSGLFANNESSITEQFKSYMDESIFSVIKQTNDNMKEQGGTGVVYVSKIAISSSCSTIPNTKNSTGKIPTFIDLSTARANTTRDYIVSELKKRFNTDVNPSIITINPNGSNTGNLLGTSGPQWKMGADPKSFEQYKFVKIDLEFAVRTEPGSKRTPSPDITVAPKTNTDFIITFSSRGRKQLRWYPNPNKPIKPSHSQFSKLIGKVIACPVVN